MFPDFQYHPAKVILKFVFHFYGYLFQCNIGAIGERGRRLPEEKKRAFRNAALPHRSLLDIEDLLTRGLLLFCVGQERFTFQQCYKELAPHSSARGSRADCCLNNYPDNQKVKVVKEEFT